MPHSSNPAAENWEARQFEAFGNLKVESANPELGNDGATVASITGEDPESGSKFVIAQSKGGQLNLFADDTMNVYGGTNKSAAGCGLNMVAINGDIAITCHADGSIKISGKNIIIDAGQKFEVNANSINFKTKGPNGVYFDTEKLEANCKTLKKGNLAPRECRWGAKVTKGFKVGTGEIDAVMNDFMEDAVPKLDAAASKLQDFVGSDEFNEGISKATEGLNNALSNFGGF